MNLGTAAALLGPQGALLCDTLFKHLDTTLNGKVMHPTEWPVFYTEWAQSLQSPDHTELAILLEDKFFAYGSLIGRRKPVNGGLCTNCKTPMSTKSDLWSRRQFISWPLRKGYTTFCPKCGHERLYHEEQQ